MTSSISPNAAACPGRASRQLAVRLLATILAFGVATPALAQANVEPVQDVDAVTVWGTAVSSTSLYVGEEDIAIRQADHLSDLLRTIPGVEIGGTHSVNQRINFRGLDDRDLAIYIDGALQTNYLFHHMGNLLINADILKSADVQLGTNTVTHGGLGGALRFETKDAADLLLSSDRSLGARLMASYHSNAQRSWSGTAYGRLGDRFDALAYYHVVDRDNFEDGEGVSTVGSDGETRDALFKLGFTPGDRQRFELSYESLQDEGLYTQRPDMGVRTNLTIRAGDILLPTRYERETINARYELDLGPGLALEATWYANDLSLWRDERGVLGRGGVTGTVKQAAADNQGVNVLAVSRLDQAGLQHRLTYGVQLFDQNLSYVANVLAGSEPVEQSALSLAAFLENRITFANGFVLRPGVRLERYEQNLKSTGSSDRWSDINFALGAEWPVTDQLRLLASYTELFKGPELAEAFIGGGLNKIVNPDLEPETGRNLEAGVRYTQAVADGRLNLGANVFHTRIENYVGEVAVPAAPGRVWDLNRGTAEISGLEASASYGRGGFDALLTYSRSELDDDDLAFDDTTESLREIGDTFGLELAYSFPNIELTVGYTGLWVMEQDLSGAQSKPGYDVHNISARWAEPGGIRGLVLIAGVDNLFDEFYTSHASRTGFTVHPVFGPLQLDDVEPGRNFKVTIAQSF